MTRIGIDSSVMMPAQTFASFALGCSSGSAWFGSDPADQAADLCERDDGKDQPEPEYPVRAFYSATQEARPGHFVHAVERGLTVDDRVLAKLDLDEDFDEAADDDQPHQDKARLGTHSGCRDEFARPDDRASDDQARAELAEDATEGLGWV